jgi:hypothetical protein
VEIVVDYNFPAWLKEKSAIKTIVEIGVRRSTG